MIQNKRFLDLLEKSWTTCHLVILFKTLASELFIQLVFVSNINNSRLTVQIYIKEGVL